MSSFESQVVCGGSELPEYNEEGYCYLSIVKKEYVSQMKEVLGPWPLVSELLHQSLLKFDHVRAIAARVARRGASWHFVSDGSGVSIDDMFRAVVTRVREKYAVGSFGCSFQATLGHFPLPAFSVGFCERLGGDVSVASIDLLLLHSKQFDQCRCLVHAVPLTKSGSRFVLDKGVTVGCVQKPAGKAGVLSSAYLGKPDICHADESVREADKKFLTHVISGDDPGTLDGRSRNSEFAKLCTSSSHTDLAAFGNGYCYLSLMHKDTWWRCARLLGPNPRLKSVYQFLLWAGKSQSKLHKLTHVSSGLFHVAEDKSSKGTLASAGRQIANAILLVILSEPDARIGAVGDEPVEDRPTRIDAFPADVNLPNRVAVVGPSVLGSPPVIGRSTWTKYVKDWCCDLRDGLLPIDKRPGLLYDSSVLQNVFLHGAESRSALSDMVDIKGDGSADDFWFLTNLSTDGVVDVDICNFGDNEWYCWYLGPGWKGDVEWIQFRGAERLVFPKFGGLAVWFRSGCVARVGVSGSAALVCLIRKMSHAEYLGVLDTTVGVEVAYL